MSEVTQKNLDLVGRGGVTCRLWAGGEKSIFNLRWRVPCLLENTTTQTMESLICNNSTQTPSLVSTSHSIHCYQNQFGSPRPTIHKILAKARTVLGALVIGPTNKDSSSNAQWAFVFFIGLMISTIRPHDVQSLVYPNDCGFINFASFVLHCD